MSWWMMVGVLLLGFVCKPTLCGVRHVGLSGTIETCDNEGEEVKLPAKFQNVRVSCRCKGGQVECEMTCRSLEGCYMVVNNTSSGTCDYHCKGCSWNGTEVSSGSTWRHPEEPCTVMTCEASVLTVSTVQCHTPCQDPIPPKKGECCPTCRGCEYMGVTYRDGDEVIHPEDLCLVCKCERGNMMCQKQACPVLSCPHNNVEFRSTDCCPRCRGSREVVDLKTTCLLGSNLYLPGERFQLDQCTGCRCSNGMLECVRETCPTLQCPVHFRDQRDKDCCAKCFQAYMPSRRPEGCSLQGNKYKEGEAFLLDKCTQCKCQFGSIRCQAKTCPETACPRGHKPYNDPTQCCQQCREESGVCTVFGDPHYRTFDGRVFNFQGACKYILSQDCHGRSFSVLVNNDARKTRSFSWTKTVVLRVNKTKITLGQHLRVKINGRKQSLPFVELGVFSIMKDGYNVIVKTNIGVELLWDGNSFLELSVSPKFKRHLCGLCGNFNRRKRDDFTRRRGGKTKKAYKFGKSWRAGGKKACSRPEQEGEREPLCQKNWEIRIRAVRQCNALRSYAFDKCHGKVNPTRFFKSCLLDMCECPSGRCYCEALTAYARECERKDVALPDWRKKTGCHVIRCPAGAIYDVCGPPCPPRTCKNYQDSMASSVCMKPCVAGCQCPAGTVLHKHKCIKPEFCPR